MGGGKGLIGLGTLKDSAIDWLKLVGIW